MDEEPLLEALPEMLPGLFEAFNDSNADVRKAVVFCLVRAAADLATGSQFSVRFCVPLLLFAH